MTTDAAKAAPLDSNDIAALRAADIVIFRRWQQHNTITAALDDAQLPNEARVYSAREQRLFPITDDRNTRRRCIDVSAYVLGYDADGESWGLSRFPHTVANYALHNAAHNGQWQTITRTLKPDDTLDLAWQTDSNDALRAAGFARFTLTLTVRRGTRRHDTYLITGTAEPADSPVRMIRPM